jgi:hypothetical protein
MIRCVIASVLERLARGGSFHASHAVYQATRGPIPTIARLFPSEPSRGIVLYHSLILGEPASNIQRLPLSVVVRRSCHDKVEFILAVASSGPSLESTASAR